jgi:hypothetical protein
MTLLQQSKLKKRKLQHFIHKKNYYGFCNEWFARLYIEKNCPDNQCSYIFWECPSYLDSVKTYQNITFYHKFDSPHINSRQANVQEFHLFWDESKQRVALCKQENNLYLLSENPVIWRYFTSYSSAIAYCVGKHEGRKSSYVRDEHPVCAKPLKRKFFWSLSELCTLTLKRNFEPSVLQQLPPKLITWVTKYDCLNPKFKRIPKYTNEELLGFH